MGPAPSFLLKIEDIRYEVGASHTRGYFLATGSNDRTVCTCAHRLERQRLVFPRRQSKQHLLARTLEVRERGRNMLRPKAKARLRLQRVFEARYALTRSLRGCFLEPSQDGKGCVKWSGAQGMAEQACVTPQFSSTPGLPDEACSPRRSGRDVESPYQLVDSPSPRFACSQDRTKDRNFECHHAPSATEASDIVNGAVEWPLNFIYNKPSTKCD